MSSAPAGGRPARINAPAPPAAAVTPPVVGGNADAFFAAAGAATAIAAAAALGVAAADGNPYLWGATITLLVVAAATVGVRVRYGNVSRGGYQFAVAAVVSAYQFGLAGVGAAAAGCAYLWQAGATVTVGALLALLGHWQPKRHGRTPADTFAAATEVAAQSLLLGAIPLVSWLAAAAVLRR